MNELNAALKELLDKVYAKCIPDHDSGCMTWTGAVQPYGSSPSIKNNGKGTSLRRLILATAKDRKVDKRLLATYSCGNKRCVRLEHLCLVGRGEIQRRTSALFNAAQRIKKSQKLSDKARTRAKLTVEIAKEIRESPLSQRTLARQYGISQVTVNSIKNNKTWIDRSCPFWRIAMGAQI